MMKIACHLALFAGLFAFGLSSANAQGVEKSFSAFTTCTGSFFKSIEVDADTWRTSADLASHNGLNWIKTSDRNAVGGNVIKLKGKPEVAGLTLTHYLDEISDLGTSGLYYYWGFKIAGTLDDVVEQLKPIIFHSNRLRKDQDIYVRTEVKAADGRWTAAATQSGSVPGLLSTERALLIEQDPDVPNTVKVLCSIQGDVSVEILQSARPDIPPKEYPRQLSPNLFEETPANEQPRKALLTALAGKPDWSPKFKRVTYDARHKLVELIAGEDGLLNMKESYSRFKMQRQMAAGLIQLKSRMNANKAVNVTEQLTAELPTKFEIGEVLKFSLTSNLQPSTFNSQPTAYGLTCEVRSTMNASKIFASLTGDAVLLNCIDNDSKKSEGKAFLKDLGIFIEYTPASLTIFLDTIPAFPTYLRFDVER